MPTFQKVKLGDVTKILSGGTPDSSNVDYWENGDICWVTLPDCHKKYLFDTQRKITKLGLKNSSAKLLPVNTVIFSSRATIGEISITKIETSTNQGSKNFICNPEVLHFEYLYYYLKYKAKSIKQSAGGTTYKEINKSELSNLEICLPDIKTQTQIASVLSAYDDLIENNEKRIKDLEEMAQLLYTEWFVKFKFPPCLAVASVKEGGHEKTETKSRSERSSATGMINSGTEYGMIPEGWKVKKIKDSFQYLGGGTPSRKEEPYWRNGGIDWYTPTDLSNNRMFINSSSEKITDNGLKNSSSKLFPEFSVMMTSRATIGRISINTKPATTNQGFIVCIPNEKVPLYFLYFWLKSKVKIFIDFGTGATFKEITKNNFGEIKILIPRKEIITEYRQKSNILGVEILNIQRQTEVLSQTRDLLIPQLVTGKRELKYG